MAQASRPKPGVGVALRGRGVKVATGDVSDGSHVGSAALGTFSAVVVPEAAVNRNPVAVRREDEVDLVVLPS